MAQGRQRGGGSTGAHGSASITLALALALACASPAAHAADPALRGHGGPIRALAALADGSIVTGGFDAAILHWDLATGTARRVLRLHDSAVNALVALDGDCFASAGEDGRIARWCGAASSPGAVLEGHSGRIAAIARSPDSTRLASASFDGEVRLWRLDGDASAGAPDATAAATPTAIAGEVAARHRAPVTGVAFGDGGQTLISASYDGEVRVTGIAGGAPRHVRQRQFPAAINGLAMLPDGRAVLSAADGRLRVLAGDLTSSFEVELPDGPLTAIAVSPDGGTIAVAGMRTPVTLIDVGRRDAVARILGPGLPVWALAFAVDGRALLTGGADRALRRWSLAAATATGETISEPADPPAGPPQEEGARVFRACIACHATAAGDGPRAGPTLHGIMGRRIATAPGYVYSEALKSLAIVWTPETIARLFEVGPAAYTPGTKMPEQRITDPADRKALVEWLARVTRP